MSSNTGGLKKTAEAILASKGHDLTEYILDSLEDGDSFNDIAARLMTDHSLFVSSRQLRRWVEEAAA